MDPFCIEDLFQMTTLAMPAGSTEHSRVVFSASRALREGDCYQSYCRSTAARRSS